MRIKYNLESLGWQCQAQDKNEEEATVAAQDSTKLQTREKVKEDSKENDAAAEQEIRRKSTQMLAEVERKVERSLVEKLEAEVSRLTQALEAGDEDKDQISFEREFAQKEIEKLRSELKGENRDLKEKLGGYETELNELKSSFNKMQRDYDRVKHELKDAAGNSVKYQNMYESIKDSVEQEKKILENKNTELNEQLDEYAEAYKVLEEKYKGLIQARLETPQPEPTPKKKEEKKIVEEATPSKDPEPNEAVIAGLKKKVAEDVEAKKALREIIKLREDMIKKQKETIEGLQKQLEANKGEIQYSQSQLAQKNVQVKTLTTKVNELIQELDKYKKGPQPEEKKAKPRTAASIVKQKLKQEKLEKVEAKPYLFGPKMEHDDLSDFNY